MSVTNTVPFAEVPNDYLPKAWFSKTKTGVIVAIALAAIAAGAILLHTQSHSKAWIWVGSIVVALGGSALLAPPLMYFSDKRKVKAATARWQLAEDIYNKAKERPAKAKNDTLKAAILHLKTGDRAAPLPKNVLINEFIKGLDPENKTEVLSDIHAHSFIQELNVALSRT